MRTYAETAATLTVDGPAGEYAYRRFGRAGGIPLVLCMRLRGTIDHWDPALLDVLGAEHDVIVFDNRGTGRSTGEPPSSVAELTEGVLGFIDALGLTEIDLLGWSMGCYVAQGVALARPAVVRRLIVAGSAPGGVPDQPQAQPEIFEIAAHEQNTDEDFLTLFFPDTEEGRDAGLRSLRRLDARVDSPDHRPVSPEAFAGQLRAIGSHEGFYGRLGELAMPVLVANGAHDVMIHAYGSYAMSQRLPDAKVVLYSDAGHGFLFQHPDDFGGEVLRFLR